MWKWVVAFAFSVSVAPGAMAQEEISGTARVIDGDTLEIGGVRLSLAGVDAAEPGQRCARGERLVDCGIAAGAQLSDLTAGVTVSCVMLGLSDPSHDAVEGISARCVSDGYDLSEGMVYTGWALVEPGAAPLYRKLERDAEASGRGLWRYRFVAPWEWREGKRLALEEPAN